MNRLLAGDWDRIAAVIEEAYTRYRYAGRPDELSPGDLRKLAEGIHAYSWNARMLIDRLRAEATTRAHDEHG